MVYRESQPVYYKPVDRFTKWGILINKDSKQMARKKLVDKKTRTIKVYETTALLIDSILKTGQYPTVADTVEDWAKDWYPVALEAVDKANADIASALAVDDKKRKQKPKQ